jgi:hypothetical protein
MGQEHAQNPRRYRRLDAISIDASIRAIEPAPMGADLDR